MTVFSPPLSPSVTYVERQAYRHNVLHLPGPIDHWLLANIQSSCINFLQDYLMFADTKYQHIKCIVEIESEVISLLVPSAI